jgi:hypothetical protein
MNREETEVILNGITDEQVSQLNEYEAEFLDELPGKLEKYGRLTERQAAMLLKIVAPKVVNRRPSFRKNITVHPTDSPITPIPQPPSSLDENRTHMRLHKEKQRLVQEICIEGGTVDELAAKINDIHPDMQLDRTETDEWQSSGGQMVRTPSLTIAIMNYVRPHSKALAVCQKVGTHICPTKMKSIQERIQMYDPQPLKEEL